MKLTSKKKIWEVSTAKHQTVLDDLQKRISEMKTSTADIGDDTYDNAVLAQKNATYEVMDTIQAQLEFAQEEMDLMNTMDLESKHDSVHFGSVVQTNKRTFFLSVSIEEFKVDDHEYFGLSLKSPLGKAMLGKKVGDSFSFNETKYTISGIY